MREKSPEKARHPTFMPDENEAQNESLMPSSSTNANQNFTE